MKQTTPRFALAFVALATVAFVLAGCGPKPLEPGKTDTAPQKVLRKDKSGND